MDKLPEYPTTMEIATGFLKELNEEIINLKKQIAELEEDRDYYKRQMYDYITKYENLKDETDLTT